MNIYDRPPAASDAETVCMSPDEIIAIIREEIDRSINQKKRNSVQFV